MRACARSGCGTEATVGVTWMPASNRVWLRVCDEHADELWPQIRGMARVRVNLAPTMEDLLSEDERRGTE